MMQLNEDYQQDNFLKFLEDDFLADFKRDLRSVNTSNLSSIQKAHYLGESKSLDLQVFEFLFEGSPNKRVALTKDAFSIMKSHATFRALAVFHSSGSKDWRFSLMTATPEPTEKGKVSLSYSNPKRLSFFLGTNAKINTPTKFLISKGKVVDFDDLKNRFSIEVVNKEFYKYISEQFTRLNEMAKLPDKPKSCREVLEFSVRLIGRIIFCWFLREKKSEIGLSLMPKDLLSLESVKGNEDYYHKILEPIFFEVLNKAVKSRIDDFAKEPFSSIPYLNGGLFFPQDDDYYKRTNDDFQSQFHNTLVIPDGWLKSFFEILETYNFTIDENTSYDEELSIDPEMLGRIFENLLAEINPETGESARKSTGSYYTPRIIVNYMVDESLLLYLKQQTGIEEKKLRAVISYDLDDDLGNPVTAEEKEKIIDALEKVKILDPACGSGAFPIGALQKIVFILQQTDPDGLIWKNKQLAKADPEFRRDIETKFSNNDIDFLRKLAIIRKSIYGIDIQPIATEISRLRCFLTLIVDEEIRDNENNRGIRPLPNLDFKFVTANSLIGLPSTKFTAVQTSLLSEDEDMEIAQFKKVRDDYFTSFNHERDELKSEFYKIKGRLLDRYLTNSSWNSLTKYLSTWDPFGHEASTWFDQEWMFGIKEGFDIVIANPPYVSTKGTSDQTKKLLEEQFGFADDLYSHFYFKGIEFCKEQGVLSYITSKTFWTIQTKKNLRDLLLRNNLISIYDTDNPFESVMVDTSVVLVQKDSFQRDKVKFLKSNGDYTEPSVKEIDKEIYENAVNKVIFNPSSVNLAIYEKYNNQVKTLMDEWWPMINTSKNINKYDTQLECYRKNLKWGEVTLLGLITDGGVGLQTGNNGRFIGVKEKTKQAQKILESRPEKLWGVVDKKKIQLAIKNKNDAKLFIANKTEGEIRILFDSLKDKFGINLFGKGYIYRIVSDEEIIEVSKLTEQEKENGINKNKPNFVPYDKGDKDGNRWYLVTPFLIDWSEENVNFMKNNSGKVGEGMTVFRNPQFYFKEGFSWNLINGTRTTNDLKFTITAPAVNDMAANKLTTLVNNVSNKYIAAICNSKLINTYTENFINFTVNFPHNSTRQIPIIVPTNKQAGDFEKLFDRARAIKVDQFDRRISNDTAKQKLDEIQKELDKMVYKLYDLKPEEIEIVENKDDTKLNI